MSKSWYILHTFSGHEKKIFRELTTMIENGSLDSKIVCQVKLPTEEIVETKNGKNKTKSSLLMPSYLMIEMDLPTIGWKDSCTKIRQLKGVTGFVGVKPTDKPRPIKDEEAVRLLTQAGEIKGERNVRMKNSYEVGDRVKITEGPFASFEGLVDEVYPDKNRLRVNVMVFNRETPVDVDALQVEKL